MSEFTSIPFTLERKIIVDFLKIGKAKHTAYAIVELEITGVRDQIRRIGRKQHQKVSLTGYFAYCLARAVAADKRVQGYRHGNRVIIFEDVDIATMVEREINGEKTPSGYIIRKADKKNLFEISEEIDKAHNSDSDELMDNNELIRNKRLFDLAKSIGFVRRWFLRRMARNPFVKKKLNGTVGLSSMGMFTYGTAGWVVPITPHTLTIMVAGIRKTPALVDGQLINKEVVDMTIAMDHDILDGAPTTRFVERLRKLLAKGIEESPVSATQHIQAVV